MVSSSRSKVMAEADASLECIVKLGGSAVTDKSTLETPRLDAIRAAADIISQVRGRCIVVHGAGSFGHFQAREHGVVWGYRDKETDTEVQTVKLGFCRTRQSVTKLLHIITEEFVRLGIPAVGVSPLSSWVTDDASVVKADTDNIRDMLLEGFLPVMHGDAVLDRKRGCTILSGDTIIKHLCSVFRPPRVVFLTDVPGIYDRPPEQPGAQLIPEIQVDRDRKLHVSIATSSQAHDVTGGIALKLKSAIDIVTESNGHTCVMVCGIQSQAAVRACVEGQLPQGTGTIVQLNISKHPDEVT
ncbi:isopentenyl phosphate kinase-like [Branchiostoma floridae]|uniref:Isopentenyl phosphate kinase n=1 Tax=Branchiostoma floridae TaxID=7739 RepID=A0A9J7KY69_BRAFL|nr:isopentenyl phosphate kinase-like [Branchiostoma floridae]